MPATRFSKVSIPRVSGNSTAGDVITKLAGLDMVSPVDEMAPGRTPYAKNFRLYQQSEAGREVAVSTRKGQGFYTTPLGEALSEANTSSVGASTAQVGVDTQLHAQSFTAGLSGRLTRFDIHAANGSATSVLRIDIYSDDSGKPDSLLTSSSYLDLPDVADWVTARFVNAPELTNGATYWAVLYLQDDGAGFAELTTTTDTPLAHSSNAGVIGLSEAEYGLLYRTYITPTSRNLGAYRFNRDDGTNKTLAAYGTTMYVVDEATDTLTPLIGSLSSNATEYVFTNGDGKVFWVNGYDNLTFWDGRFEADISNLITNPGFETNTTGWATQGSGSGVAITRSTAQFNSGVASLNVTATSGQRGARFAMTIEKGKRYKMTAWVKGATAASNAYFYLVGPDTTIPGTTVSLTTSWQKIELYYAPTADATSFAVVSDGNSFFLDDVEVKETGIEYILDSELPILRDVTFHKNRVFGVSAADRNMLHFSEEMGNPSSSPVREQWYRQWLSVSKIAVPRPFNGSPITSITSFQDNLVITTQDMKYVLSGTDRGNYFLRESTGSKGALSRRGVVADPNFIYLVGNDGIYRFNGSKDEKVSLVVQPLFDKCPRKHDITLALWKNDLRCYMSSEFSDVNDIAAIYSQDFNEWMLDTDVYVDRALYYSDADDDMELVEFSSQTGTLYLAEVDFNSLGAPIDFDYRLRYDSRGAPGQKKKFKRFVPLVQSVGRSFPIIYGNDRDFEDTPREKKQELNIGGARIGEFFIDDGTIITGSATFKPKKTSISGYSYYMQFRIRRNAVNNQVAFMGVQFTYKAKRL